MKDIMTDRRFIQLVVGPGWSMGGNLLLALDEDGNVWGYHERSEQKDEKGLWITEAHWRLMEAPRLTEMPEEAFREQEQT